MARALSISIYTHGIAYGIRGATFAYGLGCSENE
jgi:hypothetical protein